VHLFHVEQGGEVVLHARHVDGALLMPVAEAIELGRRGVTQVALEHARDLADPAVARPVRVLGRGFDEVQGLVDELGMLPDADVLHVREANIGMAVVDDIQRVDRHGSEIR